MQFEHIVQINALDNPAAVRLTREQLWQGLLLRVRAPERFLPNITSVTFEPREDGGLLRRMRIGEVVVVDRITLLPGRAIEYLSEATESHRGGELTVTIAEPAPDALHVRFAYRRPDSPDPEERALETHLQRMWQQIDLDAMRLIRSLAEAGAFDMKH
jgi:hypothetical protein